MAGEAVGPHRNVFSWGSCMDGVQADVGHAGVGSDGNGDSEHDDTETEEGQEEEDPTTTPLLQPKR